MASPFATGQPDVTAKPTMAADDLQPPRPAAAPGAGAEPVPVAVPVVEEAPPPSAPVPPDPVDPGAAPVDDTTAEAVRHQTGARPLGPPGFASIFATPEPHTRRERRAAAKAAHRAVKK
jgi:hypothetical protein